MDAKDEVKQRLSVEEVVGDYLELKRSGRNWKGLSPFTAEKTPSLMVSPEKQIWHDFSSNKGGDIFSFVMEVEGVEFREALEMLAKKANVELEQYQTGGGEVNKLKKRMSEALKLAAQYYHVCLSKQPRALGYVKDERHFTSDTIRQWQLGYSPSDGRGLLEFLKKRGFGQNELSKAGLITKRRTGWQDMFRGRLMIPLCDAQGSVVGFTARLLTDDKNAPKYFNTPQTLLYDKGRQVFGLHHAKETIRKQDSSVLVEGNLDVIASHQAGITNVVAAAGTAMTADHLRSLSRFSQHVRLAFDADQAGLNATERAISIAQTVGVELTIISMPEGVKDPDELIQTDPAKWSKLSQQSQDAVSWILQRYEQLFDKTTAEGKRQLSTKALEVIKGLSDPVEREHHLQSVATNLGVSLSSLQAKLNQQKQPASRKKTTKAVPVNPDLTAYEDNFLALNACYPEVRDSLKLVAGFQLQTPDRQAVLTVLSGATQQQRLDAKVAQQLHLNEDYVKILELTVDEKYASFSPADLLAEAMALARRIKKHSFEQTKVQLTAAIAEAESQGNEAKAATLLADYQQLIHKE